LSHVYIPCPFYATLPATVCQDHHLLKIGPKSLAALLVRGIPAISFTALHF
jgi:hypothetical protein